MVKVPPLCGGGDIKVKPHPRPSDRGDRSQVGDRPPGEPRGVQFSADTPRVQKVSEFIVPIKYSYH